MPSSERWFQVVRRTLISGGGISGGAISSLIGWEGLGTIILQAIEFRTDWIATFPPLFTQEMSAALSRMVYCSGESNWRVSDRCGSESGLLMILSIVVQQYDVILTSFRSLRPLS